MLESDRVHWHRVRTRRSSTRRGPCLVDLHQRRRRSLGEPGCFASQAFHDFHREVVERLLDRGQLRISWLELDGTPAAAEYHFADRTATYAYQGGVDPDRLEEEPGRLSTILVPAPSDRGRPSSSSISSAATSRTKRIGEQRPRPTTITASYRIGGWRGCVAVC